MAVHHAMLNVTWQLFPVNGSFYDPRMTGLIVAITALFVIVLWGPKTLTQYRFSRSGSHLSGNKSIISQTKEL